MVPMDLIEPEVVESGASGRCCLSQRLDVLADAVGGQVGCPYLLPPKPKWRHAARNHRWVRREHQL